MPKHRRVLGTVVVAALALETSLQLAALIVWDRATEAVDGDPGQRVVLCVGDSVTFGTSASSPRASYPSGLERLLREQHGASWRVVNRGWPGATSRDVLCRLEHQLRESRPRVVCVMCGPNDRRRRPQLLELEASDARIEPEASRSPGRRSFELCWRTGRMLNALFDVIVDDAGCVERAPAEPDGGDGPVGRWRFANGQELRLDAASGLAIYAGEEYRWRTLGSSGIEFTRLGGEPVARGCLRNGDLVVDFGSVVLVAKRVDPEDARADTTVLRLASQRLGAGEPADALALFETQLGAEDPAVRLAARSGVIVCAARCGDVDRARVELASLAADPVHAWSVDGGAARLRGLTDIGAQAEAFGVAVELRDRHPRQPLVHAWYALLSLRQGVDRAAVRAAVETARRLVVDVDPADQERVWRLLALALPSEDPCEAVASALRVYQLSGADDVLRRQFAELTTIGVRGRRAVAAVVARDPEECVRFERVLERLVACTSADADEVFAAHLEQILSRVRAHGAVPLVIGSPWRAFFADEVERVASRHGAAVLWTHGAFTFASGKRRGEFFAPDGHPNDAGYAKLAELVANRLAVVIEGLDAEAAISGGR